MPTLLLLTLSNIFMTIAWYWHLKGGMTKPLALVIAISWGIALFEYCLAVPANRIGYGTFNAAQLKTIQEILSLLSFVIFSALYLKEPIGWNVAVGFLFIAFGGFCIFHKW